MEEFVATQIRYGLKYIPANLAKSYFIKKKNDETKALRRRGFLRGICHPNEDYALLKDAHINWVRFDIPFPFDENGNESCAYRGFKARAKGYADRRISVMAVTPFPDAFLANGVDPRTDAGKEKVREIARFLVTDLQGFVGGFQISNEMGLPRFTLPLTLDEAAEFIGIQAESMYPLRGDLLIGYNSGGPEAKLHALMRKYHDFCDYVGVDVYLGCFDGLPGTMGMFASIARYLWAMTGKPVIFQEFGYISEGAPRSAAEKREILRNYGIEREADAAADIEAFTDRLPQRFREQIRHDGKNDPARYFDLLFHSDFRQHLYKEMSPMTKIPGYAHTPEGQAKFYDRLLERLYALPFVAGAIIYCWADSPRCYICGQPDCPVETRWGLVTSNGKPKPAYYAVKKQFGRMQFYDNVNRGTQQ